MRLLRSALGPAVFLAGLWLLLRDLGVLEAAFSGAARWWPSLLLVAGMAVLARSPRPGPQRIAAIGFIFVGCFAFAAEHGLMTGHAWSFLLPCLLMIFGTMLIWGSARALCKRPASRVVVLIVILKASRFRAQAPEVDIIRAFLVFGQLDIDLVEAVRPGQDRNMPVAVNITALAGKVNVRVGSDVEYVNHKAFVARFSQPIQAGTLSDQAVENADILIATLAVLGDTEVVPTAPQRTLAAIVPDALSEPGCHPPAMP